MANFNPTPQQQAFIDALRNGSASQSIALVARAGCGKTSTIMLGVDAIRETRPEDQTLVIAFNKAIADEVKEKIQEAGHAWPHVQASTLHSQGLGLLRGHFGKGVRIDGNKMRLVRQYGSQIQQLVGMGKQEGFGWKRTSAITTHGLRSPSITT